MDFSGNKMQHGEPQWDAKYNGLIDALNSGLGGQTSHMLKAPKKGQSILTASMQRKLIPITDMLIQETVFVWFNFLFRFGVQLRETMLMFSKFLTKLA